MGRRLCHLWHDLDGRCTCLVLALAQTGYMDTMHTIPNNSNPLPLEVVRPVPSRRVHTLPLELVPPRDIRPEGLVQLSNPWNQHVCRKHIPALVLSVLFARHANLDLPLARLLVPARFVNRRVESDVRVQAVFACDAGEVVQHFLLAWVFARPVGALLEGVAV